MDCPTLGWNSWPKPAAFALGCGHVACVRLDSVRAKPTILSKCFYCDRAGSQPWRQAVVKLKGLGLVPMAFESHIVGDDGTHTQFQAVYHGACIAAKGT